MTERAPFDETISSLYDAALDGAEWPAALDRVGRDCGASSIQLLAFDRNSGTVPFSVVAGRFDSTVEALYVDHYAKIDPRTALVARMPVGALMVCHQHFDDAYAARSEFYQDFLIPNGGCYAVGAKLVDSHAISAIAGIHRSRDQSPFGSDQLRAFDALLPHLARAMRMRSSLDAARAEAAVLLSALDILPIGVVLADRTGHISHLNEAARSLLGGATGLLCVSGRIAAKRTPDDHALKAALRGQGGSLTIRHGDGPMDILRLMVVPMSERAAASFATGCGTVTILIKDPSTMDRPAASVIAAAFGLSKAEARVAEAIAQGRSIQDIADATQASRNTIRVQLQAILDKTGAGRQAELVRLILGLPTTR